MKNPGKIQETITAYSINFAFIMRFLHIIVFVFAGACLCPDTVQAEVSDTLKKKVDISRIRYHENIEKEQNLALGFKGGNGTINGSDNSHINTFITNVIIERVNLLRDSIENNKALDHRLKVKYLSGLENLVKGFNSGWRNNSFNPVLAEELIANYEMLMQADINHRDISPIVEKASYSVGNININSSGSAMYENAGYTNARQILFRKYCGLYPDKALQMLELYPDVPFADSLVKTVAYRNPNQLYDYAAATRTNVGRIIRRNSDPVVKAIVAISSSKSGQQYYPFLDEIASERLTLADVFDIMEDNLAYYKMLVKMQVNYTERLIKRDTPLAYDKLVAKLQDRAKNVYIEEINALHDSPDNVRFKILEQLSPQELYYLIVLGEDVIYTSSYKGVFNRMMQRTPGNSGDSLLISVRFDKFKKFIRLAAGYNKLDEFLQSMPDSNSQRLMMAFVRGLEKTGTLEDAVDVADSYGSIRNPVITGLIDQEIQRNLTQAREAGEKRPIVIYDILQTIFQSSQDSSINISARLKIPPVYRVDNHALLDDSGRVVQQVFFYGDKDGKDSYANFMTMFTGADWKVSRTSQWVEIKSTKGKPILIYANLPLDYEKGLDSVAQVHMREYMNHRNLKPTITIHRGHSYWVGSTIRNLAPSSKIVILGSCGGFHNLGDVLKTCPDAHIISSKEVGTRHINEPILKAINDDLKQGRNVDWLNIWKDLAAKFTTGDAKERFDNYVPPHKNLGALFIKAYFVQMGTYQ
ncbi:MAG: hypothetical protein KIT80_14420 [Chitinophagaceae bacterium]|nr:hypothetical protein [Chitinophagaceae bacterium]MCW5928108.1 hypothetical protein [Chitinophagaceae bacterium]